MQGCNAKNLIFYLKIHDLSVKKIRQKLIYKLSKVHIQKRGKRLEELKYTTKFASGLCMDILDISQGEGRDLYSLYQSKLAELYLLSDFLYSE